MATLGMYRSSFMIRLLASWWAIYVRTKLGAVSAAGTKMVSWLTSWPSAVNQRGKPIQDTYYVPNFTVISGVHVEISKQMYGRQENVTFEKKVDMKASG